MKNYEVRMTMLVAVTVSVEAENEEAAEKLAMEKTGNEEAYYLSKYDSVWEREVVEVNECEPEEDDLGGDLQEAIAYVREQLGEERLAVIRAQASVCYGQRRPIDTDYNDEVHDLLEEWGEEHDLCEEWWSESIELEDIIVRL